MELKHKFFSDLKPQKAHLLLFIILFLVTRLLSVGFEEINPDTVNWYYRSQQFVVGIKSLDFAKTYQHYHPGVTLMWVMGVATEVTKQLGTFGATITSENFLEFHVINKVAFVFFQLGLSLFVIYFLSRILGLTKSVLVVGLFSLEPFFIGNSRFLHLDVVLSLFIFFRLHLLGVDYFHL